VLLVASYSILHQDARGCCPQETLWRHDLKHQSEDKETSDWGRDTLWAGRRVHWLSH